VDECKPLANILCRPYAAVATAASVGSGGGGRGARGAGSSAAGVKGVSRGGGGGGDAAAWGAREAARAAAAAATFAAVAAAAAATVAGEVGAAAGEAGAAAADGAGAAGGATSPLPLKTKQSPETQKLNKKQSARTRRDAAREEFKSAGDFIPMMFQQTAEMHLIAGKNASAFKTRNKAEAVILAAAENAGRVLCFSRGVKRVVNEHDNDEVSDADDIDNDGGDGGGGGGSDDNDDSDDNGANAEMGGGAAFGGRARGGGARAGAWGGARAVGPGGARDGRGRGGAKEGGGGGGADSTADVGDSDSDDDSEQQRNVEGDVRAPPGLDVVRAPAVAGAIQRQGRVVQVGPIKPITVKAPGPKRLKLNCDKMLSNFAFNCNARRYTKAIG